MVIEFGFTLQLLALPFKKETFLRFFEGGVRQKEGRYVYKKGEFYIANCKQNLQEMRKEAISEEFCLLIPLKFKIGKKLVNVYEHKKLVFTLCDGDLSFDEILPLLTWFCSTYLYYDNVLEKKLKNLTNQLIKQSNRCFES